MASQLPKRFNPVTLAKTQSASQLRLPVSHFPRFAAMLLHDGGEVVAELEFGFFGSQPSASGSLKSVVALPCQRCLKAMQVALDGNFHFGFVATEEEGEQLPDALDPVVWDEKGELDAVALLEDELILRLPFSQLHDDENVCEPSIEESPASTDTHQPFSGLDELLKR